MVATGAVLALALGGLVALASPARPAGLDYTVFGIVSLCGRHDYGTLTITSGATLRVASAVSPSVTTTSGKPDCPSASQAGKLIIKADRIVNHGIIDADSVVSQPFTVPPLCPTPPYSPATGNSGGGHGGRGGDGSLGTGGSQYEAVCLPVLTGNPEAPGVEVGEPGAGTGAGGQGGGVIVLVADDDIVSDGVIRADGADGVGNTTGACATPATGPNTGQPAPRGGGAGGSIVLAGRTLDLRGTSTFELHARGGDGGDSLRGPSGGGGGGIIRLFGTLKADATFEPQIPGGVAGTNLCVGDSESQSASDGTSGFYQTNVQMPGSISTQASPGGAAGTTVWDVASIWGAGPTGNVVFRLFSDATCTTQVFTSTTAVVAGGAATSGTFPTTSAGTFYWTAAYEGDTANQPATSGCNAPNESVNITRAQPTIATQASPGNLVGAPVRDVATMSAGSNPTGTVTFRLFSDSQCTNQVFTSTNALSGGTATSDWFTPAGAGTYRWTAVYNGDGANDGATSPCNAPNESVTVATFSGPAATQTVTGDFSGPIVVNSGQSVVINGARVVGPITVNAGGSLSVSNSSVTGGITANAPAFFSLCNAQVSAPPSGIALSVTNAQVPIRVGDPAAGCAGNRFAGQVSLTNSLAVMFGANTVSQSATISNNGPGATVIKANNVFGTLACTGNAPPPTNAGQPNTAAAKTGQCTGL